MTESLDRETLERNVRLVVEFGEFQYQTSEDRYLRNITILPWPKTEIIDAIKNVILHVDDESMIRSHSYSASRDTKTFSMMRKTRY